MSDALHLVTGEFPPDVGGVSDYAAAVARGLAADGTRVHVWCQAAREPLTFDGVVVHRIRTWSARELAAVGREMDDIGTAVPVLVQWVPHAYGRRSLNVEFCRWVRRRGRQGQPIDLMVHEPFLAFREGTLRQDAAALIHRVMVSLLLSVARRVWVSIPAWADRLRPWSFGRDVPFCWLPVPSSVPVVSDPVAVSELRARLGGGSRLLLGHFGTYNQHTRRDLHRLLPPVLESAGGASALLLGRDGDAFASELGAAHPKLTGRVAATGGLDHRALSLHLQACDLLLQPYPDGVNTRRTTLMAGLAHGIPVVTTFGRDSESLWLDSGAVRLASSGDDAGTIRAALEVAGDGDLRQRLAQSGLALYARRFALEHTIRALRSDACVAA